MGRHKKQGFIKEKMLSSRIEEEDYKKFEYILKTRDGKTLQDMLNLFIVNYISGNICLSGSTFVSNKV